MLEQLYKEHYRRIFIFALSSVKNEHTASDIAQETFLRALLSLDSNSRNPLAWLYKVADNLIIDHFRSEKKVGELSDETPSDFSVADRYIKDEENRLLYRAIASLPDIDRKIITMFYFSGLSQREIAVVTGLSFVNVRVRMDRAREKLKKLLTEVKP